MAAAAIIALIHDLLLTAGIYSMTHFVVTPSTIIALLTVLGYSLYDTIVVFDKVEENTKGIERAAAGRPTARPPSSRSTRRSCARSTPR